MGLIPWRNKQSIPARAEAPDVQRSLGHFRREVDSLFDEFFNGSSFLREWRGNEYFSPPSLDLSEDEKSVTVTVEMPGLERKDIDISIERNSLIIRGEKREESEDKGKAYYRAERRFGAFRREVELPSEVDLDSIEAEYKRGVLRVRATKLPTTPEKRIPIFEK